MPARFRVVVIIVAAAPVAAILVGWILSSFHLAGVQRPGRVEDRNLDLPRITAEWRRRRTVSERGFVLRRDGHGAAMVAFACESGGAPDEWEVFQYVEAGFPAICVRGSRLAVRRAPASDPWSLAPLPMLPLSVHPIGLVQNTVVYAAAGLFVGAVCWCVTDLRRSIAARTRGRRGRCPGCSYDLRATADHCPECGWRRA